MGKGVSLLLPVVLVTSATALAGSLLSAPAPTAMTTGKTDEALPLQVSEVDEVYEEPRRVRAPERRSFLLFYPPGTEPGLSAWMQEDGLGRPLSGSGPRQPLTSDKFLRADIASLKSGFGADLDETGTEPQSFSGSLAFNWGRDRFSIPIYHDRAVLAQEGNRQFDALGLEWRRRLSGDHQLSFTAQFGDSAYLGQLGQSSRDTTSAVAQLAWTSEFGGAARPRIIGGVFLGNETAKERDLGWSGRKYYGFTLESRFTAFQTHTPFAAFQLARSDYDGTAADGAGVGTTYYPGVTAGYGYPGSGSSLASSYRRDDYSRLAAGWNWQIRPNWGLRAEAYYSLNSSGLPIYDYDRSQIFFSTRYDFR